MSTEPLYSESHPAVLTLTRGKQRLRVLGRTSKYRLSNGWIAVRLAPENGWARQAYWSIYASPVAYEQNKALGGGEGRLTRAIANLLNLQHTP